MPTDQDAMQMKEVIVTILVWMQTVDTSRLDDGGTPDIDIPSISHIGDKISFDFRVVVIPQSYDLKKETGGMWIDVPKAQYNMDTVDDHDYRMVFNMTITAVRQSGMYRLDTSYKGVVASLFFNVTVKDNKTREGQAAFGSLFSGDDWNSTSDMDGVDPILGIDSVEDLKRVGSVFTAVFGIAAAIAFVGILGFFTLNKKTSKGRRRRVPSRRSSVSVDWHESDSPTP